MEFSEGRAFSWVGVVVRSGGTRQAGNPCKRPRQPRCPMNVAGPCQASRRCRKDATIAMRQRLAANDRRPRPGGGQARSRASNQMPVVWKLAS